MDSTLTPKLSDVFSFSHFINGFFYYVLSDYFFEYSFQTNLIIWQIIHTLYELKDMYFSYIAKIEPKKEYLLGFISNNSFTNTLGDIIYSILGFYLGYIIYKKVLIYDNKTNERLKKYIQIITIFIFVIVTYYYYNYHLKHKF